MTEMFSWLVGTSARMGVGMGICVDMCFERRVNKCMVMDITRNDGSPTLLACSTLLVYEVIMLLVITNLL